jgi:GT2 family glycosyltransferase
MNIAARQLNWAFIVSTYQREHILARCLRLAAQQTRPPAEIVVVDASPNWATTSDEIKSTVVKDHPSIRWQYVQAKVRSIPCQRNQGFKQTTSEIVFFFDDDSLMYPDCAEQIMKIYEADKGRRIVGINAVHVPLPPDLPNDLEAARPSEHSATKKYGTLARMIRRLLDADNIFVPYDEDYPTHEMPEEVRHFKVGVIKLMAGWGMTYPRTTCVREPFADILRFYAAEEDTDMSYRASRHGALLVAGDAQLCHLGSKGGRLTPFLLAVFRNLNPVALHRLYSTDLNRSRRRERLLLARRFLILLAKDFYRRKWSFPDARGVLFALRWMDAILGMSEAELHEWYPRFQKEMIDKHSQ